MMKKRYRLAIIMIVMAICFVFLWPSLNWHFLTPRDQQARALQTREQIRHHAIQRAEVDFQRLLVAAREDGDVPDDLSFLIRDARRFTRDHRRPSPESWDAQATLSAFPNPQSVRYAMKAGIGKKSLALGLCRDGRCSLALTFPAA